MALTFAATLMGAACVAHFGLQYNFLYQPAIFLTLTLSIQLVLLTWWLAYLAPRLSPLRRFPLASQGPWWKTFLLEPTPTDLQRFMDETPNDGLIRYFGVFHGERLLLTKPQATKDIMLLQPYNYNKIPVSKKLIGQLTGRGLLVVDQDEHKRQRKSLNPAFKFKYIKNLFPRFWFHATQLVQSLEKEIDMTNRERSAKLPMVDVDGWMMRATLDIMAATGFGVKVNAIQAPDSALAKLIPLSNSTSPQASFYRLLGFLLPEWVYLRVPIARRYELDQVVKALRDATMPLIQSKKAEFSKQKSLDPEAEDGDNKSTSRDFAETDVIATLLRFPQQLSDKELLAQSMSILLAGQDTTSVATTWALYLMAHHPQIQSRLRQEVRTSLPSPARTDGSVDASLVESLPYLAAICSETLRLFPPAPILRREVVKAGTTILDEHIPVGTQVITSIWGTHRTRHIWGPDVLAFKPERFLRYTEDGKAKFDSHGGLQGEAATYCLLPFGAGVRSCIGERFARGEFAILLAALVGNFEWTLIDPKAKFGEDVKVNFGLLLKPDGGLFLHASKVEGW
ncbi:hypothetical protein PV11_06467 [Exophiala sideris]|uniref:Cytochrome P450 n=1 Tax=Exophiala sideris TaxID=1016849 RepID=A0A0D1YVG8_9EURO|nr:hypothetical protein PV11_06467 [Exophiala sideris]